MTWTVSPRMVSSPITLTQALLVGAGGFFGCIARFGLSRLVHRVVPGEAFPSGTLVVNVLGCLAMGLLAGLVEARQALSAEMRLFLLIGLLGGFTTFSSFGYETWNLWRAGHAALAAANVVTSIVFCLVAVWLGFRIGNG